MIKKKAAYYLAAIAVVSFFILWMQDYCSKLAKEQRPLLTEDTLESIRAHKISLELLECFREWAAEEEEFSFQDYLCAYLITGEEERSSLKKYGKMWKKGKSEEFKVLTGYLSAVWEDLVYFPVPLSAIQEEAGVSYVDSWMYERTFGGKRGHEGTDLMAAFNERGRYPVVSMTDGVVEQVGWLTKGGYRLGIRSPHGGYFYYAHLYDYAREFQPGDPIKAGEWIGFMGDSGYSDIEGTVGNFDVHLHLGIYVNQPDGSEMSINPFVPLQFLEDHKLKYIFSAGQSAGP